MLTFVLNKTEARKNYHYLAGDMIIAVPLDDQSSADHTSIL